MGRTERLEKRNRVFQVGVRGGSKSKGAETRLLTQFWDTGRLAWLENQRKITRKRHLWNALNVQA